MERKTTHKKRANQNVANVAKENPKGQQFAESQSIKFSKSEIRTVRDYGQLMLSLVTDVIQGKVSPKILNAAVNAGRQVMKAVEIQAKYSEMAKPTKKIESKPSINLLTGEIE